VARDEVSQILDASDPTLSFNPHHALFEQSLAAPGSDNRFAIRFRYR
jgi:hypothetical protein